MAKHVAVLMGGLATERPVSLMSGTECARALRNAGYQVTEIDVGYDVAEKSISDLQTALTAGRTTSAEITQTYLERIAAYDQQGPSVNSVIYINPNALRDVLNALDPANSHLTVDCTTLAQFN